MATRTNKRTGEVQEMQPDGSWKTIVAPRQGAPALSVQTKGADPTRPATVRKTTNEARASDTAPAQAQANLRKTQAEIDNDRAAIRLQQQQFEASLAEKGLMVGPDGKIIPRPGGPLKPTVAAIDPEKAKTLKALQDQVDRVGTLYRQNIQGGLPNPLMGRLPTSSNGQFDAAAQGLTNPFLSAFRVQGQGSQSDTELKQFLAANTPSAHDTDLEIEEKLGNIQRRIDAETGKDSGPVAAPNGEDVSLAKGKTQSKIDPVLRAASQRLGSMVAQNVPDDKILDFMKRSGIDPANTNIGEILRTRATDPKFKQWQRQNPGKAYPIGPNLYTKEVPMSGARALGNMAAQSAPGAFLASAANGVTGGYLDNMTDNPEMARTGMQLLRSEHPVASLAGDVAGYATDEALLGRIPGAQGLLASKLGRRGADAAYGAFSGSGENDQDRLGGALLGAGANTVGGMAGRGLQKGVGDIATGVKNANLGYLNNAGVPLTLGQIGNGTNSVVGKAIGGLEDRAAGIPIFDAIINSARRRGEQGFNRAAFKEAGGSGATGARGVEELHGNVNNAYSFLDPVTLPLDAPFAGSQAGVRANIPNLVEYGPQVGKRLDIIDRAGNGGVMSGRDWQQALRGVKADRSSLRGQQFSEDAINSLGNVEDNLMGLADRQAPAPLKGQLGKANSLNKQFKTIVGALDNGPAQARGELFSPVRLDTSARASARKFGGQTASIEGNRPFYDLTQAGMDVMPNQVPDSGTAGRALMYSALFGAGLGSGLGYAGGQDGQSALQGSGAGAAAVPFALAALYSKPGQKVLQKALLAERPAAINVLGDVLKRHPKIAGLLGSGLLRDYIYQPELPPQ
jgi:hypothetical protein